MKSWLNQFLYDNMEKAPTESNLSITSNDINIELSKEFLVELRKNIYHGTCNEDVVEHIAKVLKMVDLIYIPGVDSHQLRMKVFPLSFADDAKEWWISEGDGKITTWEKLVETFFCRFYPESYAGEDEMLDEGNNWGLDPLKFLSNVNTRMDDSILSSNNTTDSFFKPYLITYGKNDTKKEDEQSQTKHKYSNTSNPIDDQPNKRRCKAKKFEAIQYSLGPNEEYISIREYEFDIWERNDDNMSKIYQDIFQKKDNGWKELRENTFSGSDNEEANEHIEKLLEIVELFHVPNITEVILFYNGLDISTRQILDSRGAIPTMTAADATTAIQEIAEYSQKWHNGTSRGRKEWKSLEEAYYTQFGGPFQGGGYRATAPRFGSLPSSTKTNLRDQVKSISTTIEADLYSIRHIGSSQYAVSTGQYESRQTTVPFPSRLDNHYCEDEEGNYGLKFTEAYEASHINNTIPRKEKDQGSFTLPCFINNTCFDNALVDLGAS
ncbi:hypothetical protein Tco_0854597, partial [Tanacetum coccineum]